jgi:hypothetical protein
MLWVVHPNWAANSLKGIFVLRYTRLFIHHHHLLLLRYHHRLSSSSSISSPQRFSGLLSCVWYCGFDPAGQHFLFGLKFVFGSMISDVPPSVVVGKERQHFLVKKHLKSKPPVLGAGTSQGTHRTSVLFPGEGFWWCMCGHHYACVCVPVVITMHVYVVITMHVFVWSSLCMCMWHCVVITMHVYVWSSLCMCMWHCVVITMHVYVWSSESLCIYLTLCGHHYAYLTLCGHHYAYIWHCAVVVVVITVKDAFWKSMINDCVQVSSAAAKGLWVFTRWYAHHSTSTQHESVNNVFCTIFTC